VSANAKSDEHGGLLKVVSFKVLTECVVTDKSAVMGNGCEMSLVNITFQKLV